MAKKKKPKKARKPAKAKQAKKARKSPAGSAPRRRAAEVERKTRETGINLSLLLDGSGKAQVATPIGFLDHMLEIFARHALVDLELAATGDVQVDQHHTVEDLGISLGLAVAAALGEKKGIVRVGFASVPLDEALAQVTLDLSGRPYFSWSGERPAGAAGELDSSLLLDFLQGFATHLKANLCVELRTAGSPHHTVEAVFKALARALRAAAALDPREKGVPSTKGVL